MHFSNLAATFLILSSSLFHDSSCLRIPNDRPIIGVIAEETGKRFVKYGSSSIVASYVKYLESSGARVVPIMIRMPEEYYSDLLRKINGVLLPGGADLWRGEGYSRTGKIIFEIATEMNNRGDYFPIWGTCLGLEMFTVIVSGKSWMKACDAEDLATNIHFLEGFKQSRIFNDVDKALIEVMQNNKVTINYHQWCMTPENFTLSGLNKFFKVLATNQDSRNDTFISIIEAYKYPYYAVAFHPEKVIFEWVLSKSHSNIPHGANAIQVSQYFSNFFVNEARKSHHSFPNKTLEDEALIYNYEPTFTGKMNSSTIQYYFFP